MYSTMKFASALLLVVVSACANNSTCNSSYDSLSIGLSEGTLLPPSTAPLARWAGVFYATVLGVAYVLGKLDPVTFGTTVYFAELPAGVKRREFLGTMYRAHVQMHLMSAIMVSFISIFGLSIVSVAIECAIMSVFAAATARIYFTFSAACRLNGKGFFAQFLVNFLAATCLAVSMVVEPLPKAAVVPHLEWWRWAIFAPSALLTLLNTAGGLVNTFHTAPKHEVLLDEETEEANLLKGTLSQTYIAHMIVFMVDMQFHAMMGGWLTLCALFTTKNLGPLLIPYGLWWWLAIWTMYGYLLLENAPLRPVVLPLLETRGIPAATRTDHPISIFWMVTLTSAGLICEIYGFKAMLG